MKIPSCYLSGNDETGWQVIQHGMPATSERATKADALQAAEKAFKLKPEVYYNGETFVSLECVERGE